MFHRLDGGTRVSCLSRIRRRRFGALLIVRAPGEHVTPMTVADSETVRESGNKLINGVREVYEQPSVLVGPRYSDKPRRIIAHLAPSVLFPSNWRFRYDRYIAASYYLKSRTIWRLMPLQPEPAAPEPSQGQSTVSVRFTRSTQLHPIRSLFQKSLCD